MPIDVVFTQGDISQQEGPVLVSETDTDLGVVGGVGVKLWEKAGQEMIEEARKKGPVGLGEVVVTDAYSAKAKKIFHAAVMPHYGDRKASKESIEKAVENIIKKADDNGFETVLMPLIGCGVGDFSEEKGIRLIKDVADEAETESLEEIKLVEKSSKKVENLQSLL